MAAAGWFRDEASLVRALQRGRGDGTPTPTVEGYENLIELGRGGQGVVYAAVDRADGSRVAIKVIRADRVAADTDRRRFEREIDLVATLDHPHLVSIRTSGVTDDGRPYLVMDYVEGVPLDEHVLGPERQPASLPDVRRVLQVFVQVCDAVHYAHQHGVIHRDLKPSNIRVDASGRPHVLDFGLALPAAASDATVVTMTGTGEFVGTLAWASPEQIDGRTGTVDLRSDVFSLGAILYQLLAARRPFDSGTSLRGAIDAILLDDPRPLRSLREIDPDVETIVLRCLAKDRVKRYQSAGDVARDIRRHLGGEPIEARREGAWSRAQRRVQRYRLTVAAVAVVAVGLAASTVAAAILYVKAERAGASARAEAAHARAAVRFLEQTLSYADPRFVDTADPTLRAVLDAAAARYRVELAGQPKATRDVALTLGRSFYHLAEHDKASSLVSHAVRLDREREASGADLAESLSVLALVRHAQGRLDESAAAFEEALDLGGDADAERVRPLLDLGNVYAARGSFDQAEAVWRQAAGHAERAGSSTGLIDFYVGRLLLHRNRIDAAEATLVRARHELERLEGPNGLTVADCLQTLASLRLVQERPDEAIELAAQAIDIYESRVGKGTPRAAHCLVIMGQSLLADDDVDAALARLSDAETIYRARLGDDHSSVGRVLDRRGFAHLTSGDPELAEPFFRESLKIYRANSGETNSDTALVKANLGCCLRDLDRDDEAEQLLREGLAVLEGEFGPDDPRVVQARKCLDEG